MIFLHTILSIINQHCVPSPCQRKWHNAHLMCLQLPFLKCQNSHNLGSYFNKSKGILSSAFC